MKQRKLGRTNWDVSEIGFGGWGIGRTWWGPTDDKKSLEALKAAWEAGINFYDTAFVYGDGHSEELIAKALAGKDIRVATKIPPKNGEWPGNPKTDVSEVFPSEWIMSCTERSLKKLNRDIIDLTQFHVWTDEWLENDEWKEAITRLKKAGKIRSFGVSINDHQPDSALQLVASGHIDTVQVIFNIFDQTPTEKLFPLCKLHKVGVIARVPFDEGGLTGQLRLDTKFEGDDFRKGYFRGDHLCQTVDRVEKLKILLQEPIRTLPELALKFILSFEEVSVVIPGMRTRQHVLANAKVSATAVLPLDIKQALIKHAWPRNYYGMWD